MRSNRRTPLAVSLAVLVMVAVLASCQSGDPSPNRLPSASFVATGAVGIAPLTVSFDASLSSDPDGSIVSYLWDFGTGGTGSGVTTSHVYQEPGNYTVRLTVTDDRGGTATATAAIQATGPSTGRIAGTITIGAGTTAASVSVPRVDDVPTGAATAGPGRVVEADRSPSGPSDGPEVIAGEWIVKFRPDAVLPSASGLTVAGVRLDTARGLALPGTQLLRAPGLGIADTLAVAAALAARPDVVYAQPNYRLHALAVPNDEFYSFQWHYPAINLPAAWDITTGSTGTVVAVVDSGILFAAGNAGATHPDFAGKVLAGYDFVSNPQSGGDGDGRDPDPYDLSTGHHGSHVAGTIAAATNNAQGVAGVDWQARIVPVRVLGADGSGSLDDIIDGTLWAAGFPVSGVPANPNPAHVINLSLGGGYTCTPFEQEAFDLIESASPRRGVVVVAAGNSNVSASGFSPASCSKVITVGATEFRDFRAPYSNYGPRIDVMAPGGDMGADLNGDQFADGVLSLGASETEFLYTFENGTSMAAPHVAGVVSLMKALDPDVSLQTALALLQGTARPLNANACQRPTGGDCGAGLIDAAAALAALQQGAIPTPGGGTLAISPNPAEFGSDLSELTITLANGSGATVDWSITGFDPSAENPGEMQNGTVLVDAASGSVAANATASLVLAIDRSQVTADGAYQFALVFDVDGQQQRITVRFRAGEMTAPSVDGPTIVAAFLDDGSEELLFSGAQESASFLSAFDFEVLAGDNLVIAWTDVNDNVVVDDGDYIGVFPFVVRVAADRTVGDVDIAVERVLDLTAWRADAPAAWPAGDGWRRSLEALRDPR